ncbi:hypothetical protein [Moorena sp. SIO3I6]|nr:hypothetical protein [Moorena sp. SIO3I6]
MSFPSCLLPLGASQCMLFDLVGGTGILPVTIGQQPNPGIEAEN